MLRTSRRALCGLIATGALAGIAVASEPESGTVSNSSPKVQWTMSTTGSYFVRIPVGVSESADAPCEAPTCETFTLTLADTANLTIAGGFKGTDGGGNLTFRITKPDDSIVFASSDSNDHNEAKPYKVLIKGAATGEYKIDTWNNADTPAELFGFAEIPSATGTSGGGGGGTTPPPTGGGTPPTGGGTPPSGGGSATPPPAPVSTIDLSVKVGKVSARKLKKTRKLPATVTVSREVTSIVASLKKGKKTVGKGKLGKTSGTKKLTLKTAKKLKKGTYALTVLATDGKTSTTKTIKVKVGK